MMVAVVTRYVCAEYMDLDDWVTCNNPSGRVDMSSIITNHPLRFFIGAVAVPLAPSLATPAPPLPPGQETSCLSPASYRCDALTTVVALLGYHGVVWRGAEERIAVGGGSSPGGRSPRPGDGVRYESRRVFSMLLWSRARPSQVGGRGEGTALVMLDDRDCDYEDV
jgi:hypothetical protein